MVVDAIADALIADMKAIKKIEETIEKLNNLK